MVSENSVKSISHTLLIDYLRAEFWASMEYQLCALNEKYEDKSSTKIVTSISTSFTHPYAKEYLRRNNCNLDDIYKIGFEVGYKWPKYKKFMFTVEVEDLEICYGQVITIYFIIPTKSWIGHLFTHTYIEQCTDTGMPYNVLMDHIKEEFYNSMKSQVNKMGSMDMVSSISITDKTPYTNEYLIENLYRCYTAISYGMCPYDFNDIIDIGYTYKRPFTIKVSQPIDLPPEITINFTHDTCSNDYEYKRLS